MRTDSNPRNHDIVLVATAVLVSLLPAILLRHWWVDDAAISFSYARSLASGDGLVPFAGAERAEAYSDPLWVAVLAAGQLFGLDPFPFSKVLGAALAAACVPIAWQIAAWLPVPERSKRAVRLLSAFLVATNAQNGIWAAPGLENALYSFLLGLGTWRLLVESEVGGAPWSALVFVGVALTRPEGVMYAAVAGAGTAWVDIRRGRPRRAILWAAVVVFPFALYQGARYAYFAVPYPLAFYAKVETASASVLHWRSRAWSYPRRWAIEAGWGLLLPVLIAGVTRIGGWRWKVGVVWMTVFAVSLLLPESRWIDGARIVLCTALGVALPVFALRRGENPLRFVYTTFTVATLAFTVVTFGDWMSGSRRYSIVALPLAGLYAIGVAEIAAWTRARGRGDGPIALLAGLPVVWHLIYIGAYALHPLGQTPFTIRVRVRSFDQIAKQIHLDRPWVSIDHAMGGNTWFAPPSRTIDWFGLTNVASALERAARLPVANHLLEFLPWVDFAHAEKVLANRAAFLEQFVRVPKTTGRTDDDWMRRALLTEPRWVGPPTRVSFTGGPTLEGVRVRSPEVHAGGALYVEIGLRLAAGDSDDFDLKLVLTGPRDEVFDASPGYDGLLPPAAWLPNEVFVGRYAFPLPSDLPNGDYALGFAVVGADGAYRTAEVGASTRATAGVITVSLPDVVHVLPKTEVRAAAERDWDRAARAAATGACLEAEEAWRDALEHEPMDHAWKTDLDTRASVPFAACWVARADAAVALGDKLDDLRRARRWDVRSVAAQASGARLANATWPEAMAARNAGDATRAHALFEAILTADPTRAWARRYAEDAWRAMGGHEP